MPNTDKGFLSQIQKSQNLLFMVYFLGMAALSFCVNRSNFCLNYGIYFFLFCAWIFLVQNNLSEKKIFALGCLARFLFLWSIPQWSDDFHRFIWDGKVLVEGINPYLFTPNQLAQLAWTKEVDFNSTLLSLNSPNYYTVYPTVVMFLNWICVFFGKNVVFSVSLMKLLFVFADTGIYFTLKNLLKIESKKLAWYWLCPLIIIEFTGNLHHELWLILFLLLALYFLKKQKIAWLALFLSLAIFTKLTPLLFVPFFFYSIQKKWLFSVLMVLFCGIMAFPMVYNNGYIYFLKSVHLYFSSFEFNSSFYALFTPLFWLDDWLQFMYKGIVVICMICFFWYWKRKKLPLIQGLIGIQWIYLLSAQSVHPWYILPLLALYILSELPLYYLAWLLLIPLSYITYASVPYQQQIWVNCVEYCSIGFLFWYVHHNQRASLVLGTKRK